MSPASAPPTVRVNVKAPLSTRATTASPLSARPRSSPLRISPLTQSGTSTVNCVCYVGGDVFDNVSVDINVSLSS